MSGNKRAAYFLVLLAYYIGVCVFFAQRPLKNDEWRYRSYAKNLTKGFYAPEETKHLWNGPGYPLFVSIFVFLKMPLVAAKYFNALFLFGAVLFFWRTMSFYVDEKKAFWCAFLFGLYPPFLPELPRLLTESISVFLIAGFAYFIVRAFKEKGVKLLLVACLFGGYLILTKVMYAYVITAALVITLGLSYWRRDFLRFSAICSGCLIICLPYLAYTYSLTGKLFYWANSGGTALHCMSRPSANEWGTWFNPGEILEKDHLAHHRPFFETLEGKNSVEKDRLFKKRAIENIRQKPANYVFNWLCNLGRMWFNYPFAYKYQRPHTLFYMFPNGLLLSGLLVSIYPLIRSIRYLPAEIVSLWLFALLFLSASSLIYTCSRYLVTIVPVLLLLICYCWCSLLHVQWRQRKN